MKKMNWLWFPTPTQLLIQGQWWSKRSTHMLQMAQCLLRGVRITLQSGHISQGCTLRSRSINGNSGFKRPGSLQLAIMKEIASSMERKPIEYAKNLNFWSENISQREYLLGTIMKICAKMMMLNKVANSNCVLWFFLSFTIGVFTMKHSMYLGSFNRLWRSAFIPFGRSSFIIYIVVRPALLTGDLLAPLMSNARTGLVVLSSGTLLTARCNAVKPEWSYNSRFGLSARM